MVEISNELVGNQDDKFYHPNSIKDLTRSNGVPF